MLPAHQSNTLHNIHYAYFGRPYPRADGRHGKSERHAIQRAHFPAGVVALGLFQARCRVHDKGT